MENGPTLAQIWADLGGEPRRRQRLLTSLLPIPRQSIGSESLSSMPSWERKAFEVRNLSDVHWPMIIALICLIFSSEIKRKNSSVTLKKFWTYGFCTGLHTDLLLYLVLCTFCSKWSLCFDVETFTSCDMKKPLTSSGAGEVLRAQSLSNLHASAFTKEKYFPPYMVKKCECNWKVQKKAEGDWTSQEDDSGNFG